MANKILETVIINAAELEENNPEFVSYFCERLGCPWRANGFTLRNVIKIYKVVDGYLIEYEKATWGNTTTQYSGLFMIEKEKESLISHYF